MRKIIKGLAIFIGILLLVFGIAWLVLNEKRPTGETGPAADALAQKMLRAIDKEAWDTTAILQWNFAGMHNYLWDKKRNLARITWGDKKVLLNPDQIDGRAWEGEEELNEKDAERLIQKAWGYWCNDSFWFNAVVKCFDPGTQRSIVKMEDGSEALMVSYESGGVTPGDAYLWILDENGLPQSWKMWVKIIPFGGLEFTWEDWVQLDTGTKIASMHKSKFFDLPITDIKGAASMEAFGLADDPFAPIAK